MCIRDRLVDMYRPIRKQFVFYWQIGLCIISPLLSLYVRANLFCLLVMCSFRFDFLPYVVVFKINCKMLIHTSREQGSWNRQRNFVSFN